MKLIIKLILLIFIIRITTGCDSEMISYKEDTGVYLVMQKPTKSGVGDPENFEYIDTTWIDFALLATSDTNMRIRIRILGDIAGRDREVALRLDEKSTTAKVGEDYEAFELQPRIPALQSQVDLYCRIMKTDKLYQYPDTVIYLAFELLANETFILPFSGWAPFGNMYGDSKKTVSVTRHVFAINNAITIPAFWSDKYWGAYSAKKLSIMCTLFHMTLADFNGMNVTKDNTRALIMGQNFDRYLKEKEKDGDTVFEDKRDENGDLVKMTAGPSI